MQDNGKNEPGVIEGVIVKGARGISEEDVHRVASDEVAFNRKMSAAPSTFIDKVGAKLELLLSAIRDYASGTYREVPWMSIAVASFAILYFINPADIIPDVIPLMGFVDDAGVIAAAYAAIMRDLSKYELWKKAQDATRKDAGDLESR